MPRPKILVGSAGTGYDTTSATAERAYPDTQPCELRRAGALILLEPQVFKVLAYLVMQPDCIVSRDQLFARLRPEQFVTADALTLAGRLPSFIQFSFVRSATPLAIMIVVA